MLPTTKVILNCPVNDGARYALLVVPSPGLHRGKAIYSFEDSFRCLKQWLWHKQ
jgi:hypothetical protein